MVCQLFVAICAGLAAPAHAGDDNPAKIVALPVEESLHLALHEVSYGGDSAVLEFGISLQPPAKRWFHVSVRPWITKLTDAEGHSLYDPAPEDNYNRGFKERAVWCGPGRGIFPRMNKRIKSDKVEVLGVVEAAAEITFAADLEYINLGELTNEAGTVEIAKGATVHYHFKRKSVSCSCTVNVIDERDDRSGRFLVGIETFDADGKESGSFAEGDQLFHTYKTEGQVPKTGRLVIASKIERVPVRLHAENVELDDVLMKKIETMSPDALREIIANRRFSDQKLYEMLRTVQDSDREELSEILVDAGARVVGREEFALNKPEVQERHFRLFQRYMKLAKSANDQTKIDWALGDSYDWGGAPRYRSEALAAGAQLIHMNQFEDSLLMHLWLMGIETAEVVETYAHEVLDHGPKYEIATQGGFNELLAAAYMGDQARVTEEMRKSGVKHKDKWGNSALIWASSSPHSDEVMIKGFLEAGLQLGDGSEESPSALIAAIKHKRFDLASIFVKAGAIPLLGEESRRKVLLSSLTSGNADYSKDCFAAGLRPTKAEARQILEGIGRSGDEQLLKSVLEVCKAASLSAEDIQAALNAGLASAVRNKSAANIQMFWDVGARIAPGRSDGDIMNKSAMFWATNSTDQRIFEQVTDLAIQQGYLETIEDANGVTAGESALVCACSAGNKALVDKLLANGVVPTGKSLIGGTTVLCAAASSGSIELVKMFLDRGFDVNGGDAYGRTPIIAAMSPKWTSEMLDLLIERGANIKLTARANGPTVVSEALRTGDVDLLRAVRKRGALFKVSEPGRRYDALSAAIQSRRLADVKMLLEVGEKPGACDTDGVAGKAKSHVELAKKMVDSGDIGDSKEILKLIEEAGK